MSKHAASFRLLLLVSLIITPSSAEPGDKVPSSVVLINGVRGSGIGSIAKKDLVITAHHVVGGDIGSEVTIFLLPDFEEKKGRIIYRELEKDLAAISLETGDRKPFVLAQNIELRESIHWYRPATREGDLATVNGVVLVKLRQINIGDGWLGSSSHIQDEALPVGKDLILEVSGETPRASSGGPGFNKRGEVVGILVSVDRARRRVQLISADGIRKFLNSAHDHTTGRH